MKNRIRVLSCLLLGLVVASCTTTKRLVTLHLVGTKEIDSSFEKGPQVEGEDCGYAIFYFNVRVPTLHKAIEDALVKGKGELLLDIRSYEVFWGIPAVFPAVYLHDCYHVSGTVLRARP